jgi:hypothetical protein
MFRGAFFAAHHSLQVGDELLYGFPECFTDAVRLKRWFISLHL